MGGRSPETPRRPGGKKNLRQRALERNRFDFSRAALLREEGKLFSLIATGRQPSGAELDQLKMALAANLRSDHIAAEAAAEKAVALFAGSGNKGGENLSRFELVYALQRLVKVRRFLEEATRLAADLAREGGPPWLTAQSTIQLGIAQDMAGHSGEALDTLRRAGAIAREAGDIDSELRASGILAETLTHIGDTRTAWVQGVADMERYWSSAAGSGRAYQVLMNQMWAADVSGWDRAALELAAAAVRERTRMNEPLFEISARTELAGRALRLGEEALAAEQVERAGAMARGLQGPGRLPAADHALLALADARLLSGDAEGAIDGIREVNADTLNFLGKLSHQRIIGEASLARRDWAAADSAFGVARNLLDERLLSLPRDENRIRAERESAGVYRAIVELRLERDRDWAGALEDWERFRAMLYGAGRPARPVNEHLPQLATETVLVYAMLRGGLAIWAVDDRGVQGEFVGVKPDELARVARRFSELCAEPTSPQAATERDARQLYQWLVAPVASRLAKGRLLAVQADSAVASVPFAALIDSEGSRLGEAFPIMHVDSLAGYLARRERAPTARGLGALLVADPELRGEIRKSFPPFVAAPEPTSLSRHWNTEVLRGPAATLANFNRGRERAGILHFHGHGTRNADNGALLLASERGGEAEILRADAVAREDWSRCRLAVLSACSTGRGETAGTGNPESLVRAFLHAGATNVIASRWDVDASTTAELFEAFYRALASGERVSVALWQASSDVRRRKPHPYYWASFSLHGTM